MNDRPAPKCKYCGSEMVKQMQSRFNQMMGTKEYHGHYACQMCGSSAPESEYLTDLSAAEESAYAAATQRLPNRPLTLPELFDLDDNMDAVWVVDSGCGTVVMGAEEACEWASDADTVLFFARKPTTTDIEAARKELDCK